MNKKDAWLSIPKPNKYVENVSVKKFKYSPFDEKFISILEPIVGDDPLRPIMSSINFSEKGICVTDAWKLMYFNHKSTEFNGNYCTTKKCVKLADKSDIKDSKIEGKYPNYEAIIPKEFTYVYDCDLLSIKTYIETIIRCQYTSSTTKDINFRFNNDEETITFGAKHFLEICEANLSLGYRKVKIGIVSSIRAIILTPDTNFGDSNFELIGVSDFSLVMPFKPLEVQNNRDYKGSELIDYEIQTAYSFTKDAVLSLDTNEYHKIDTSLTEKDAFEGYVLSMEQVEMFKKFKKQNKYNSSIYISNFLKVEKGNLYASNMTETLVLKNTSFEDGIYSLRTNAFFKNEFLSDRMGEYMIKPQFNESNLKCKIDTNELSFNLSLANNFINTKDEIRPLMGGVHLYSSDNNLTIESTDATAGYVNVINNKEIISDFDNTISSTNLLVDILNYIESKIITFYATQTDLIFDSEQIEYTCRNIDGKFPVLKQVYPSIHTGKITTNQKDLKLIKKSIEEVAKKHSFKNSKDNVSVGLGISNEENKIKCIIFYDENPYRRDSVIKKEKEFLIDGSYDEFNGGYESKNYPLLMPSMVNTDEVFFGLKYKMIDRIIACSYDSVVLSFSENTRPIILESVERYVEKNNAPTKKEDKIENNNDYLESKLKATELLLKFKRNSGSQEEIDYLESKIKATKILIKFKGQSFEEGGLVAPNGKPSNLTPEQWKLVRTPEFKAWFGDWENDPENASKVVDENGEPLVVYHGTKSWDIYEFDLSKSKRISSGLKEFGTYFTDNKKLAESYRDWSDLKKEEITDIDKEIYKWEEILYKTRNNRDYDYAEQQIKALKELKKGKIYGVFLNLKKMYSFDAKKETNIEAWNNLEVKASYKLARNRDAMDLLKEGKFGVEKVDGIQAKNIVDAFVQTEELKKELLSNVYLVFDSKNIKLADGTNTTFDSENPDIRFNEGGEVDEKYQYVVDEIKKAIIDLGLPYLNYVDEFNRYYLSKSKNDFGQSWYMIFLQENRPLEIRISDHSVTSSSRIMDDKYIAMLDVNNPFKYTNAKSIAKSLDLEFKRLKDVKEKRNKLFDEEREKRDYMSHKLQSFLDKLKSENKSIGKNDRTYQTLEEIIIKHPDWEYIYHYPNNGAFSFYFVKNDKSGSLSPYFINEQYFNFLNDNGYLDNLKTGGQINDIIEHDTKNSIIFEDKKQEEIDEEIIKNQFGN